MANFKGFPKELFTFFENLKQNNSKDWFEKNRKDHERFVTHPAREYVEEMGDQLRKIAPGVHAIPKINKSPIPQKFLQHQEVSATATNRVRHFFP